MNEVEAIKNLLESRYVDVTPPQQSKVTIIQTIEFIRILKELGTLYTKALVDTFGK
jgi:hypothetical protein